MELELRNGVYLPVPHRFDNWADKKGYCSGYARLVSISLLTGGDEDPKRILWNPSDAWNFGYKNRTIWKKELGKLDFSILRRGYILGIFYPPSSWNHTRDERKNQVQFTHLAAYIGDFVFNGSVGPWIMHNLEGNCRVDDLKNFLLESRSEILAVYVPKKEVLIY